MVEVYKIIQGEAATAMSKTYSFFEKTFIMLEISKL